MSVRGSFDSGKMALLKLKGKVFLTCRGPGPPMLEKVSVVMEDLGYLLPPDYKNVLERIINI